MLIVAPDCVYELLTHGSAAERVKRQIVATKNSHWCPPNMVVEVFALLLKADNGGPDDFTSFKVNASRLQAFKMEIVDLDGIADAVTELIATGLPLNELLYVASAQSKNADILTTKQELHQKLRKYADVVLV